MLAALAWAVTGLLVRSQGGRLHAIVINAARCTIAGAIFVAAYPLAGNHSPIPLAAWGFLGISLVAGLGIGDSLYFEALKRIGVARAMPISMGYPVLASIGAVVLLGETLGPWAAVGIPLTLGGVYLVAVPRGAARQVAANEVRGRAYWLGVGLAATAAVSWSCSTLALRPALDLVDVPTAGAIRMPIVSVLLWITAGRTHVLPQRAHIDRSMLRGMALTGLTTIAATGLFLQSVALAGAGRAAVLNATSPLFAVPFSVLFLGERGSWRLVAGTLCSVTGVVLLAQT